ncbi:MAG TPA: ATP-binding protein [Treponema sp.]|nr:ATP-binding protein [Treponema sp.]
MADENKSIDVRKQEDLAVAIDNADVLLNKSYLSLLNTAHITEQFPSFSDNTEIIEDFNKKVRFFDITQIVLNKSENMRDKLVTVFNSVGTTGASLLMHIKGSAEKVRIQFGVRNQDSKKIALSQEVLEKNLKANFPGSLFGNCDKTTLKENVLDAIPFSGVVSTVTDVAGFRFEEETKDRQFMQGIEKLIDTLQGENYSLLLVADPISLTDLNESRRALENLYSSLVPFCESQFTLGANESDSVNQSITNSITDTVSNSVTTTVTHTVGKSETITDGTSKSINISGSGIGAIIGTCIAPGIGTVIGGAIGSIVSGSFSKNHSEAHGTNESDSTAKGETKGNSHTEGNSKQEGSAHSDGSSQSLQIKFENHGVKKLLERIDETLKRYNTCADLGMWNCAVYCISESEYVSQMAASVYQSLIRGKNSSLENGAVTLWDKDQSKLIINSLKHMAHPMLDIGGLRVTPGTLISSSELAIEAGLPNHSVPGIPVIECAEFGRTVATYDDIKITRGIELGKIYNMHTEEKLPVELDADSLTSHTFITGSTGSGKSNTVYQILSSLQKRGINFLVVEPAKGEYKSVFGSNIDVSVYGTNPDLEPLLRINPFSFPHGNEDSSKNIHILEHLDRLIEIFNVCWPMYAAMPAVLKEAVEKSYEDCGWNLTESTNKYGSELYPTFADVTRNIRTIIDSSEYDAENKGAYKGSLITRLKSLTNGINALIFNTNELDNKDLFDENVIVDLSRVGSTETKSLIMGLLVLKLQEYRMTSGAMNASLRHVTVLEEAHNLLKRTSTEQSQDSGNLLGKSVEMLTNSIAEMRTYGEGFIIADQAPALLDMAVIRNTNTKIIMRLPDKDDRELVGKAANLNDDQIIELAKLPRGVAAVYQNEWVEAVLCKVKHFVTEEKMYSYTKPKDEPEANITADRLEIAKLLCKGVAVTAESDLKELKEKLNKLNLHASTVVQILRSIRSPLESPRYTKLAPIVSELFPTLKDSFIASFNRTSDTEQWTIDVDNAIREQIQSNMEEELLRSIRQCIITNYLHNELGKTELLEKWANQGGVK